MFEFQAIGPGIVNRYFRLEVTTGVIEKVDHGHMRVVLFDKGSGNCTKAAGGATRVDGDKVGGYVRRFGFAADAVAWHGVGGLPGFGEDDRAAEQDEDAVGQYGAFRPGRHLGYRAPDVADLPIHPDNFPGQVLSRLPTFRESAYAMDGRARDTELNKVSNSRDG